MEKFKKIGTFLVLLLAGFIILGFVWNLISSTMFSNTPISGLSRSGDMFDGMEAEMAMDTSAGLMDGLFRGSKNVNTQSVTNNTRKTYNEGTFTTRKIIKNANLTLYVKDAEETAETIKRVAMEAEGFVSESRIYESTSGYKSGNVSIRIPSKAFEGALLIIKKAAVEVEQENIKSQDVTEEYIDLEAQLRNLRAEEGRYLDIMARAVTVDETLKVSRQLSDVRGRVERIEGKLKYLSSQVEMSTINVSLKADADVKVFGLRWRPLIVAKRSIRNMFEGLTGYVDFVIGFIFMLPVILLWGFTAVVVAIPLWKMFKWLKRKFFHHE